VDQEVLVGKFEDAGPGQAIPAIASSRLIEIYNKSFAPARKLPQLSPQMIAGFVFPIEFNRSYVASTAGGAQVQPALAQIAGLSDRAMLAGITVPLAVAVRINQQNNVDSETFTGATLQARDPSGVPRLIEQVKRMGLQVDDQERRLAENAGLAVALTTSALALLSVLICVLAAVNIAHALSAQVRARAKEIGVMRAVGATRSDVQRIVLTEAAVTGLVGGAAGTLVAFLSATLFDRLSSRFLPDFPFKPDTFFGFPPTLLVGGVLLGVLAALAGAYLPSRRAAALDPARTLAG
jgi:ABC-type antimicrobial peptide transport system permease subunit